ncbi:MAG: hypothetical protein JW928_01575 [Candidatus Aureabacteria bacterium]|nr:hypothetical protein [Candidatus Auribacterota bacterium]
MSRRVYNPPAEKVVLFLKASGIVLVRQRTRKKPCRGSSLILLKDR